MSEVTNIIADFETTGTIPVRSIKRLMTSGDLYDEFIAYIHANKHKSFSRALLQTATALRRNEECKISSDDLVFFSWFASRNGEVEDLQLVVSAKVVDFDAWCGFDGAMVYMVLDFEQTREYLLNNASNHPEAKPDHLLSFSKEETEQYRKNWRPPFT